jgi:hypothetical protein
MKKSIYTLVGGLLLLAASCSDKKELLIPYANDITLNELKLNDFSFVIPDGGFKSGVVSFNTKRNTDGTFSGFAYSNRNNRSFTWTNSQAAIDTNRFSVFTAGYNRTETFAVVSVKADDAFFTLDKPSVVEHILVANTTYNYLPMNYGDVYGTAAVPEINPNIKAAPKGIWYANVPGGVKKMVNADKDYFKIIAIGYKGGVQTGTKEFFLCSMTYDPLHPTQSYLLNDWYKCDLTLLGQVDKVVFHLASSDNAGGVMRTPSYFCMDGIRIKN